MYVCENCPVAQMENLRYELLRNGIWLESGRGSNSGGWENCIVMGFMILDYLQPNNSEYTILNPRRQ